MAEVVENVVRVARELKRLGLENVVFVGGATVGLYLTDVAAAAPRVTLDVDVVVDVPSRAAYYGLEERLRAAGHVVDPNGPIGRWRLQGVPVDFIPVHRDVLGFSNRWYRSVVDTAATLEVAPDVLIQVATPPMFLATKSKPTGTAAPATPP